MTLSLYRFTPTRSSRFAWIIKSRNVNTKCHRSALLCGLLLTLCFLTASPQTSTNAQLSLPPYKNPSIPIEKRVDDLVSRMSLEEKVSQMMNSAPAIEQLAIPEYNWWNEALHGVARAGYATVFQQAIGLAAKSSNDLMCQ